LARKTTEVGEITVNDGHMYAVQGREAESLFVVGLCLQLQGRKFRTPTPGPKSDSNSRT